MSIGFETLIIIAEPGVSSDLCHDFFHHLHIGLQQYHAVTGVARLNARALQC